METPAEVATPEAEGINRPLQTPIHVSNRSFKNFIFDFSCKQRLFIAPVTVNTARQYHGCLKINNVLHMTVLSSLHCDKSESGIGF
jgi:hypothetical protein